MGIRNLFFRLFSGDPLHPLVGPGVVADLVARIYYSFYDLRITGGVFPYHEKGGFYPVFIQNIQNLGSVLGVGSVIKGEGNTLLRYYLLAVPVMLCSAGSVTLVKLLFGTERTIFATIYKIVIDTILFFVTFRVQREWVFKKKTAKGQAK